jgi:competence protein ComEC
MLQGDSPQKIEKYLIAIDGTYLHSQILKLGHHGSKTATSDEYVQAVHPDYAIISDGKNNRYGFPHKETMATLAKENVPALRTDEGRITFVSDGKSFRREE